MLVHFFRLYIATGREIQRARKKRNNILEKQHSLNSYITEKWSRGLWHYPGDRLISLTDWNHVARWLWDHSAWTCLIQDVSTWMKFATDSAELLFYTNCSRSVFVNQHLCGICTVISVLLTFWTVLSMAAAISISFTDIISPRRSTVQQSCQIFRSGIQIAKIYKQLCTQ